MLKEYTAVLRRTLIVCDSAIVAVGFFVAYFSRDFFTRESIVIQQYYWVAGAAVACWIGLMYYFGMYRSFRTKDLSEVMYMVFKAGFFCLLPLGGIMYFSHLQHISRGFVAGFFLVTTVLLCFEKVLLIETFRYLRKRGYNYRNVLVVGTNSRAQEFVHLVQEHAEWGLRIFGFMDDDLSMVGKDFSGIKVLGTFHDLPEILKNNVVDEVVFVVPRSWLDRIEELISFCETQGVRASLAVNFFDLRIARARQTDLHGFPLMTFESTPSQLWQLLIKRFVDIIGSGAGLLAFAPLFLVVALLVKLTSRGPVFFRQSRSSVNGRIFTLYKFRTMCEGAEDKLKELLSKNEMQGPAFKMENDPRVTPLGKILRKCSIDELPQLWNVFNGDMSLVGPRPPIPSEVNQYDPWHRRRLSMRPGITCLWQISGRSTIKEFDEWMRLDLQYIDNWSLWLDLTILLRTVPVVLFGIGAK